MVTKSKTRAIKVSQRLYTYLARKSRQMQQKKGRRVSIAEILDKEFPNHENERELVY